LGFLELDVARMVVEEMIQGQQAHHHTEVDGFTHARGVDRKARLVGHISLEIVGNCFGEFDKRLLLVVVVSVCDSTISRELLVVSVIMLGNSKVV
jgi:hypothetical protein